MQRTKGVLGRGLLAAVLLAGNSAAQAEIAHILLDTSGSMRSWQRWLDPSLKQLESRTVERVMQLGKVPGFGLIGFTEEAGELATGWAEDIGATVSSTRFHGGVEDGLVAIQNLLDSGVQSATVLLISDEPRSVTAAIDVQELAARLRDADVVVHAVVRPFKNLPPAPVPVLRLTAEAVYDYEGRAVQFPQNKDYKNLLGQAYGALATASGGDVWLLDGVRDRPKDFADQLADWMLQERLPLMQPEVEVSGVLQAGQVVNFDASDSRHHLDAVAVSGWRWDFDGDGVIDSTGALAAHVYTRPGSYEISLELLDDQPQPHRKIQKLRLTIAP